MSTYTPAQINLTLYKGDTFSYLFEFEENGSAFDLTTLGDASVKMFAFKSDVFEHSVSGGDLSITGADNNQLNGKASKETMDLAKKGYYLEVTFFFPDGSEITYVVGHITIIDALSGESGSAKEFLIKIDTSNETASSKQLTGLTALAISAKDDAETAEFNAQTSASNASDYADDAEKQAQETTSFTDSDGNSFTKGAKGWQQDASTEASNAATSASNASDSASDAEDQAQSTTQFTDTSGTTYDKGAKGWASDAEGYATSVEDEVQEKRTEDSGYYFNELAKKHEIGKALWFPVLSSSDVVTPPQGYESLFMDTDNNNALSKKDSTGTVTTI